MPELPEVETIKRELEPHLVSKTLDKPIVLLRKCVKSDFDTYIKDIKGRTITHLTRKGKALLIHLDNDHFILFHLRMEGKLYIVKKEGLDMKHLSIFLPFHNSENGLAFYDTRKFGISLYTHETDMAPFKNIGPDPFEVADAKKIFDKYHASGRMMKELLLDQSIMSGIGNIYANEILFRSKISPFAKGNRLTRKEFEIVLENSRYILNEAIRNRGSTIRTYHVTADKVGQFQDFLQVYSRKGKECPICHHRIEKAFIDNRGTEYCPNCQKTGLTIAITGKIASGKSLATSYFKKEGFITFSADDYVHELYQNEVFLSAIRKEFPQLFTPTLNKEEITRCLTTDKIFKRKYLRIIYSYVRKEINHFIISNDHKNKALEIPVLFDAHMDDMFSIIVGVETTRQKEHLIERGDDPKKALFNKMNSYDKHHDRISYVLHTDGKKSELHRQVKDLIAKLTD